MAGPTPDQLDQLIAKISAQKANVPDGYQHLLDEQIAKYEAQKKQLIQDTRASDVQDKMSGLTDTINPFAERSPEEQAAYDKSIGIIDSGDLKKFEAGDPRVVGLNELDRGVYLGDSAWKGSASAYDDMGPSAWDGAESAYGAAGADTKDYYRGLMKSGGTDAISERDYQQRKSDAEQMRRSNTDAALQQLEQRGQGSAGGSLLAELSNQQAATSDVYSAGLDAAATAQARRDNAASGLGKLEMDSAQGLDAYSGLTNAGLDRYSQDIAAGRDKFAGERNTGLDTRGVDQGNFNQNTQQFNANAYRSAGDMNTNRDWSTSDNNTNVYNQNLSGNAQRNAAATGSYLGSLGLEGGQTLGQQGANLGVATLDFNKQKYEDEQNDPWKTVTRVGNVVNAVRGA